MIKSNENSLKFDALHPNQKWVSDITYIWTGEGWYIVASILIDLGIYEWQFFVVLQR